MNLLPPARVIRAVTFADFGEFVHPSGWPTLRTRPCAFLPSAVVNGRPTTSQSPVSSTRRSPIRSSGGAWCSGGTAGSHFFRTRSRGSRRINRT